MTAATSKSEEQRVAEGKIEGFRKALGPFVVAAETTRMPMVFTDANDPGHPIIFVNDSFLSLTGYPRWELLGKNFDFLVAVEGDADPGGQVDAAFKGTSDSDPEIRYRRKDGTECWATIFINPVRDEGGAVVQHFVSLVDVSKHKQAHAQAKSLVDELNHRVKNTLSTMQSIVWQAFKNASDTEAIRESIEARLFALSRSHDLLTREHWEGAGLLDLVNYTLEPFGVGNGRAERFSIMGSNVRLPPKAILALGIALHELATNAIKYGAFSNGAGSVLIAWAVEARSDGQRLVLRWQEKNGPRVTPASRKGFGSQVLERGLGHELEGVVHLDYQPNGLVCTIDIPAPRGAYGS
jgi:PAS domain S-box-containing protein